jgi:uncharacterized membrane protein YkoI
MCHRARILLLVSALLAAASSATDLDHDDALELRRRGELLPLETLLAAVRQRHPGATLLEAELEDEDGRIVYELEILTRSGQVRELEFDARSGDLLQDEED